jgi:hypothetical protein
MHQQYTAIQQLVHQAIEDRERYRDEIGALRREGGRARARVSERGGMRVREAVLVQRIRDTEELERKVAEADVLPVPCEVDWDVGAEEFWEEFGRDVRELIGERDGLRERGRELVEVVYRELVGKYKGKERDKFVKVVELLVNGFEPLLNSSLNLNGEFEK